MVDPDSDRVPRAPPYSGYCYRLISFGYVAFTLSDAPSQKLLLPFSFYKLMSQSYNPTYVVWAFPRSLAATQGISFDFFSRVT